MNRRIISGEEGPDVLKQGQVKFMTLKKLVLLGFILLIACTESVTSRISLSREKAVVGVPIKINVKVSNPALKPVFRVSDPAFGEIDTDGNFTPKKAGKVTIYVEINSIKQSFQFEVAER